MGKRLKLRICRAIATTLQSCRSKDPSNLPRDPVPSFPRLSNPKFSTVHFPAPQNHRPSIKHHVSSGLTSTGCGLSSTNLPFKDDYTGSHPPQFKWQSEDKWHVVAKIYEPRPTPRRKIYNSSASDDDDLTFAKANPPPSEKKKRTVKKKNKKRNLPSRLRLSTSSTDSGWFSRDEEETETLASSLSCSSSEINNSQPQNLPPIRETHPFTTKLPRRRKQDTNSKRGGVIRINTPPVVREVEMPARLSSFKRLIPCTVEGKVKESYAIVKKSEDPYQDFKNSMMDMILEKQMFEARDLEQLLQCFLSLNSRHYHETIVQAFSEIWEALFLSPAVHHHQ